MPEELHLVTELAIILIAASAFTIISKALKQPSILGYIIAGFLVGPHLGLFPQFSTEAIHEWSELGIIFLLFGLGLEFSFKKLIRIGSSAFITAGVKCIGMFAVGLIAGKFMGWSAMEGIFLGGLLGMSSTTIIIKAYDDMGLKNKPYAPLIFGSLVFEDLIAVLLLVLLSTIAVSGKFSGPEMGFAIVKLAFFIVLWFLIGIYVIPIILRKTKKFLNDETLLLVGIGLCFLMVVLANLVGFSSALGAFVMGSILSETLEGERIEHVTSNIKDLFGAIFFVSVGMMLDPAVIAEYWLVILIITLITIFGILIFSTAGALLAGKGLETAVHAGFSLAQLGEFAFIIAGLGSSLGVMREHIYPGIIAVSVITTFTTPYMIKLADPVTRWLKRSLPQSVLDKIDPPQTIEKKGSRAEHSEWIRLLKSYFLRLVLYGVILSGILIGTSKIFPIVAGKVLTDLSEGTRNLIGLVISVLIMSPFLIGMLRNNSTINQLGSHLLRKNPLNRWPILAIVLLRQVVVLIFLVLAVDTFYNVTWWVILLAAIAAALFLLLSRYSLKHFKTLENTFLVNLNEKEIHARKVAPVTATINDAMSGYDVSLQSVIISPDFQYAGKTLREMPFRHRSGVNIVKIQRGNNSITIPSGDEMIMPGDLLLAVGTNTQLENFNKIMDESIIHEKNVKNEEFCVSRISIGNGSVMNGKTLRELDMRKASCMVVSIMRNGKLNTNPEADFRLQENDSVWLAGEKSSIEWYR